MSGVSEQVFKPHYNHHNSASSALRKDHSNLRDVLSGGTEGGGDDRLRVSLQGAGAAGHGSHPEHGLRLVHHGEDLLRLNPQGLHTHAQAGHHLRLPARIERKRHRLFLPNRKQNDISVAG